MTAQYNMKRTDAHRNFAALRRASGAILRSENENVFAPEYNEIRERTQHYE